MYFGTRNERMGVSSRISKLSWTSRVRNALAFTGNLIGGINKRTDKPF